MSINCHKMTVLFQSLAFLSALLLSLGLGAVRPALAAELAGGDSTVVLEVLPQDGDDFPSEYHEPSDSRLSSLPSGFTPHAVDAQGHADAEAGEGVISLLEMVRRIVHRVHSDYMRHRGIMIGGPAYEIGIFDGHAII